MRIFYNYKKENFYQILPLLFLTDRNQIIILLGFGKKNLAFVFGSNFKEVIPENEYKILLEIPYSINASKFKPLKLDSKKALMLLGVIVFPTLIYILYKKHRKHFS